MNKEGDVMPYFNIVAQTSENTVVTEYEPVKARTDSYQSEAEGMRWIFPPETRN